MTPVALTAGFSADATKIIQGEQITFTDTSTGDPDTYNWTFEGGDPGTSTEPNPTVTYNLIGVFTASLNVSRVDGTTNATSISQQDIEVCAPELTADFSANTSKINQEEQVTFSDASTGNPDTYQWTFEGGDPATSTEANPIVTYNEGGTFRALLEITRDSDGANSSSETEIQVCVTEGLVAHFPLDGNADDISGNDHSGNINGATSGSNSNGDSDMAYDFNGVDSYITSNTSIDDNLGEGATFSAWIKINEGETNGRFISNYNGSGTGGDCVERIGFVLSSTDANGLRFTYATDGDNYAGRLSEANSLEVGKWHQVVGTWDGTFVPSGFRLYIDGVRSDADDFQDDLPNCGGYLESDHPLELGRGQCAAGDCAYMIGSMDEVRIYDRPLTDGEVLFLFQN